MTTSLYEVDDTQFNILIFLNAQSRYSTHQAAVCFGSLRKFLPGNIRSNISHTGNQKWLGYLYVGIAPPHILFFTLMQLINVKYSALLSAGSRGLIFFLDCIFPKHRFGYVKSNYNHANTLISSIHITRFCYSIYFGIILCHFNLQLCTAICSFYSTS